MSEPAFDYNEKLAANLKNLLFVISLCATATFLCAMLAAMFLNLDWGLHFVAAAGSGVTALFIEEIL